VATNFRYRRFLGVQGRDERRANGNTIGEEGSEVSLPTKNPKSDLNHRR